jgi:hypothetical protein
MLPASVCISGARTVSTVTQTEQEPNRRSVRFKTRKSRLEKKVLHLHRRNPSSTETDAGANFLQFRTFSRSLQYYHSVNVRSCCTAACHGRKHVLISTVITETNLPSPLLLTYVRRLLFKAKPDYSIFFQTNLGSSQKLKFLHHVFQVIEKVSHISLHALEFWQY